MNLGFVASYVWGETLRSSSGRNMTSLVLLLLPQVLHLTKQHAYYPEHRRFSESNISVPLSAEGAASLAGGCRRLQALRLCLGASDVTAEGLAALKEFRSLKR